MLFDGSRRRRGGARNAAAPRRARPDDSSATRPRAHDRRAARRERARQLRAEKACTSCDRDAHAGEARAAVLWAPFSLRLDALRLICKFGSRPLGQRPCELLDSRQDPCDARRRPTRVGGSCGVARTPTSTGPRLRLFSNSRRRPSGEASARERRSPPVRRIRHTASRTVRDNAVRVIARDGWPGASATAGSGAAARSCTRSNSRCTTLCRRGRAAQTCTRSTFAAPE